MFRARQVAITVKKVVDLDTIMSTLIQDPFLPITWILACTEVGKTGYEHYHILLNCHQSHLWRTKQFDKICGIHPHLQQVGPLQRDEDALIGYYLKQGDISIRSKGDDAGNYIAERVAYIKSHKLVSLVDLTLGGAAIGHKYVEDEERALKKRQQEYMIAKRRQESANRAALSFLTPRGPVPTEPTTTSSPGPSPTPRPGTPQPTVHE